MLIVSGQIAVSIRLITGTVILLLIPVALFANVKKPPPVLKPEIVHTDTVTLKRAWLGVYFSSGPTFFAAPEYFRKNYKTTFDIGGGLAISSKVTDGSGALRYFVELGFHYSHYSPDSLSIVSMAGWNYLVPTLSGGKVTFWTVDVRAKIAPRWSEARILPYLFLAGGGGRIIVDDLVLRRWENTFTFIGFRKMIPAIGFGAGLQDNFNGRIGCFVDACYTLFGNLKAESLPEDRHEPYYLTNEEYHALFTFRAGVIIRFRTPL